MISFLLKTFRVRERSQGHRTLAFILDMRVTILRFNTLREEGLQKQYKISEARLSTNTKKSSVFDNT